MFVTKGSGKRSMEGLQLLIDATQGRKPKVLHLTLKKKWFDQILEGIKKIEYRENKPYWQARLFKDYDIVHFVNGYGKHRPWIDVEIISILRPLTHINGPIEIHLGKILKTGNLK